MSNKKLCGYDLNGWSDRAARNWIIDADGEELIGTNQTYVSSAVLQPAIVRTGECPADYWIGGAQADLAPHGRGGGWGNVGASDRRVMVRDLLARAEADAEQLVAALAGLASGAKFCAISIDDHPDRSERLQERILAAVAKGRLGRGMLVWRSVLAVLGSLTQSTPGFSAADGFDIGVIGHVAEGFTLQRLRLRKEAGHRRDIFAPERRAASEAINSALGYAGLVRNAREAIATVNPMLGSHWANHARCTAAVALGAVASPELLRTERGHFVLLTPPSDPQLPPSDLPPNLGDTFSDCDIVLLETLTSGAVRAKLIEQLMAVLSRPPIVLAEDIVACGALEAARRHSEGEPVYFDFLPQISTIVMGQDGARNYDLIEANETLPAGRLYRSPKPASFAIAAGAGEFSVFLRKEHETWPRKAKVQLGTKTSSNEPVSLNLEQAPLAGRARLFIDAPALSRQFSVDWHGAEEIQRPWEDIIADHAIPPATIPARLVLPCSIVPWQDSSRGFGLDSLLIQNDRKTDTDVDWAGLAQRLSTSQEKHHCISSDGELPPQVSGEMRERLDRLTARAIAHIKDRVSGRIRGGNDSLKFLTWQFRYSPEQVPDFLIEAWNSSLPLFRHPFVENHMSRVLVYQGYGRTCRTKSQEKAAFAHLLKPHVRDWSWRVETAAAAFLLSRSDTAPLLLSRTDVERLAERVLIEFNEELGGEYTRFNYAPFLLGGLLRWRLKEPNALVVGRDRLADELQQAVCRTLDDFARKRKRTERLVRADDRYRELLKKLLDELKGEGRSPELLLDLYNL